MNEPHEVLEQLSAFLDGELDASSRREVEAHLASCAPCREVEVALRATLADLEALPEPEPSAQDQWALRAAINRARTAEQPARARWQRWVAGSSAAAAVLALIVSVAVLGGGEVGTRGGIKEASRGESAADQFAAGDIPLEVLDASLSSEDARALLSQPGVSADALSTEGGPAAAAPEDEAPRALSIAGSDRIARCEAELFEGDPTARVAVRYLAARYNDVPAFFLIYEVADPSRAELWVIAQNACKNVLFFAQTDA